MCMFSSCGGLSVTIDIDLEEIRIGEFVFEIRNLINPHCRGHECRMKENDRLPRNVNGIWRSVIEL